MAREECPFGGNGEWCIAGARPRQGVCDMCQMYAQRLSSRRLCGPCMDQTMGVHPGGSCPCAGARRVVAEELAARGQGAAGGAAAGAQPNGPPAAAGAPAAAATAAWAHPQGQQLLALPAAWPAPPQAAPPALQQGPQPPQPGPKAAPPALPPAAHPAAPGAAAGSGAPQPQPPLKAPPPARAPGSSASPAGGGGGRWGALGVPLGELRQDMRNLKTLQETLGSSMAEASDACRVLQDGQFRLAEQQAQMLRSQGGIANVVAELQAAQAAVESMVEAVLFEVRRLGVSGSVGSLASSSGAAASFTIVGHEEGGEEPDAEAAGEPAGQGGADGE